MTQSGRDPAAPFPCIVSVVGLKKSGKTAVVTALLSELRSRGHRVGSIKKMEHTHSLDAEGTDTRRHADAGAEVVVALLEGETVRFQRSQPSQSMRDILELFPRDTAFLVCEGMVDYSEPQAIVLCLRTMEDLAETLTVRGIRAGTVLAVSGVAAAGAGAGALDHGAVGLAGIPMFNAADAVQRRALTDLIIKKACPDE